MFLLLTFVSLLFSVSTSHAKQVPPVVDPAAISESASTLSDLDRFQQATVYSGSECQNCSTPTNDTSAAH